MKLTLTADEVQMLNSVGSFLCGLDCVSSCLSPTAPLAATCLLTIAAHACSYLRFKQAISVMWMTSIKPQLSPLFLRGIWVRPAT